MMYRNRRTAGDEFKEERKAELKNHQMLAKINLEQQRSVPRITLHRAQSEITSTSKYARSHDGHRKSAHL